MRQLIFILVVWCYSGLSAIAAGPVETSVFAVQGVDTDQTDVDASAAKSKALVDVQMKAFQRLVSERGTAEMVASLAGVEPKDVEPYLKSLSIERESVAPGRYIGKFTVRFLPNKMAPLFAKYGVKIDSKQSPAILILPVWSSNGTVTLWDDNPWRKAWAALDATQARVPIIVALGDAEDAKIITPADVVANDAVKLEALRRRYDVAGVLVAYAEPAPTGGVNARIDGTSPIGKVKIEKTYLADDGTVESASVVAAKRFQELMTAKFNSDEAKFTGNKPSANYLQVAVPFNSPSQWNGIRSRILSTPGVKGVDVTSLAADGAVIKLQYNGELSGLTEAFQLSGLQFTQIGESWSIQAM
jgi:hypothetical protein